MQTILSWNIRLKTPFVYLNVNPDFSKQIALPTSSIRWNDYYDHFLLTTATCSTSLIPKRTSHFVRFRTARLLLTDTCWLIQYELRWFLRFSYIVHNVGLPSLHPIIRMGLDPGVYCFEHAAVERYPHVQSDNPKKRYLSMQFGCDKYLEKLLTTHLFRTEDIRQRKIQRVINALHASTIRSIVHCATEIRVPNLDITKSKKLKPLTVLKAKVLNHAKFNERLQLYAARFGVRVIIVSEAYSSQTCCRCQQIAPIKVELNDRTFVCMFCKFVCERDFNGAINICQWN